MPITEDISTHDLFGPAILQGREEGRREILFQLLQSRFGTLPDWVGSRLQALSSGELDQLAIRLLNVSDLNKLFSQ